MTIKASGRSALILTAGLLVFFAGPSPTAMGASSATVSSKSENAVKSGKYRHAWRYHRKYARKSGDKSVQEKKVADDEGRGSARIPLSVANANAQFASADTPAGSASAMSTRASDILQAAPGSQPDGQVVAADQLNEVDRALQESKPTLAPVKLAAAEPPAVAAAPATSATSSDDNSTWDKTSLIGKVFLAFGGLLTLASAARMFIA
jgi:hypothetical protein